MAYSYVAVTADPYSVARCLRNPVSPRLGAHHARVRHTPAMRARSPPPEYLAGAAVEVKGIDREGAAVRGVVTADDKAVDVPERMHNLEQAAVVGGKQRLRP